LKKEKKGRLILAIYLRKTTFFCTTLKRGDENLQGTLCKGGSLRSWGAKKKRKKSSTHRKKKREGGKKHECKGLLQKGKWKNFNLKFAFRSARRGSKSDAQPYKGGLMKRKTNG